MTSGGLARDKSSSGQQSGSAGTQPRLVEAVDRPVSIAGAWTERLLRSKSDGDGEGRPLANVHNALVAFQYAPEWQEVLWFDESRQTIVARCPPPWDVRGAPFDWTDEDDVRATAWLQKNEINVSKSITADAVQTIAHENTFHPIRDYLDPLKWDGDPRLDDWLADYLGAERTPYSRAVGPKFLIGAVARIYKPGCKMDNCLVLEGPQGALKSTALRTLAGDEFFTDDVAVLGSKDSVMQVGGVWIAELAELESIKGGHHNKQVKAFLSRKTDRIRLPYGRRVITLPRQSVFTGSVNNETWMSDETGGRRFWPVRIGKIDIEAIRRDRDQLWAEARSDYRSGVEWWLSPSEESRLAEAEQTARYRPGPWDDKIATYISKHWAESGPVNVTQILTECIGKDLKDQTQTDSNAVAKALQHHGWERFRGSADPTTELRPWLYRPKPRLAR